MSLLFQKISLPYSYVWLGDQYKWLYNQCNYFDSNDCNCCHSVESVLTSSVRIFFSSSRLSSFLLSESLLETYFTVDMNFMVTTVTISYSCNSYCSKVPSWLTTFAPADALIMQEEAWNAFPRCKSGSPRRHDIILCVTCSF